jgi:hypothetical protein
MTARKRFKQLVRARMAKTGESYVTALQHFRGHPGTPLPSRVVRKADLGLTLRVPVTWIEQAPELRNSLNEVLRLTATQEADATRCLVLWTPSTDEPNTRRAAQRALDERLALLTGVELEDAWLGGLPARRLTGVRKRGDTAWHVVRYIADSERQTLDLGFETVYLERDRDVLEEVARSVEVGPAADGGDVDEMALFRYSGSARRVVARAADIARTRGDEVLSPWHLLCSLALTPEGDAVGVMLGALGVDTTRLGVPEWISPTHAVDTPIRVGPDLYRLLTRDARQMAVTSVKPVDILSAIVGAMPDALSDWAAR